MKTENEGDLMIAAEMITPEAINCMAITSKRADARELSPMVLRNTSQGGIAVTAYDRAQAVVALVAAHTRPEDLAGPGHMFPLRARRRVVLERLTSSASAASRL
jgi:3,4-dihydroxy 2-butanone 4-phosphate synthase/GTP cyclohydrolase II